jgi:predicted nuclease of predicted toxin-antitoxin system
MRFLVDENLSPELADFLNQMGHDAIAIVGSGLESTPDSLIWQMAFEQDRILVTQDLDFPLNIRPTPPGLVLVRYPDRFDFDVQMEHTRAFFAEQTEDSLVGKITVHAPGHTRNRDI